MVDFSQEQYQQSFNTILIGLGGSLLLAIVLVAVVLYLVLRRIVLNPVDKLVVVAEAISRGELDRKIEVRGGDEISILAKAFNSMVTQLGELIATLEERIKSRTQAIETAAMIGRRLSTILDIHQLAVETVEQLQSAFHYYHVHIYLYDEHKGFLIMTGGTGEAGQIMLSQNHKIPHGKGIVGLASDSGDIILVPDTGKDPNWLPNPLLPETRSEVAVPILVGDDVLGALDVQQNIVNSLTQQDVELLKLISSQVAVAIKNATQYEGVAKQSEEQRNISQIVEKIQSTTTIADALQVTSRELGRMLKTPFTVIKINPGRTKDQKKIIDQV